jgi:putative DNA primase/helicase
MLIAALPSAMESIMPERIITLSIFENSHRKTLSKHLKLSADGQVVKSAAAELSRGRVRRVTYKSLHEVYELIRGLPPHMAVSFGICEHKMALVLSKKKADNYQEKEVMVTRTRENFNWPNGAGVLPFDYDPRLGSLPLSANSLVEALREAVPDLRRVALAVKPSVSSCIYSEDGKELRGIHGQHAFAIVTDANRIPEIGKTIADRLWLAGYGWIYIASNGSMLERTLVDTGVWQPERLIFSQGDCDQGLIQRFPEPYISPGELDDVLGEEGWITLSFIPPLTEEEHTQVFLLKEEAKKQKAPEAREKREKWAESRAQESAKHEGKGADPETIASYREQFRKAAEDGSILPPNLVLYPQNGGEVTAAQVIANPDKWDSKRFADPIEPTYGNDPREPYIYSHAHGGMRYYFRSIDAADEFNDNVAGNATQSEKSKKPKKHNFEFTDLGNAKRLVARYGGNIRYIHGLHQWLIWKEKNWHVDNDAEIERLAKETIENMLQEAVRKQDNSRERAVKHALGSQNANKITSMIRLAQSEQEVVLPITKLDADPWVLGVKNGIIELRTCTFREAKQTDYITKYAGVTYDPNARCENWEKFMDKYTCGDKELAAYHQRRWGYILTGSAAEEVLFIMCGGGANGKTTDRETLRTLLGNYAITADASLMMERKQGSGPTPEIARLHGKRLVVVSESEENQKLNEQRIKYLTSNESITGRGMYKDFFDFMPTHKTVLTTNHRPIIYGTDEGIWRRIHYIESKMVINKNDKVKDFREKYLYPELPGILNWALKGLQEYLRIGLVPPVSVMAAGAQYRNDMDAIGHFLEQETVKGENASEKMHAVYDRYKSWCHREGILPLGSRKFNDQLRARGYIVKAGAGNVMMVFKLRLNEAPNIF